MKNFISFIFLILMFLVSISVITGTSRSKNVQTKIKSGNYIEDELMTNRRLQNLPIPISNENYAFIQSIGNVTNVVIANFAEGQHIITWIQDENADATVDQVVYYYPETNKFRVEPNPEEVYSAENFKKVKTDILNGVQGEIYPNREGIPPLKKLLENTSDKIEVQKTKNGYRVRIPDADIKSTTRITFLYSNNRAEGYDFVVDVEYHNVRETLIAPIIRRSIYCKNSNDPLIKEVTQDLLDFTAKYYPFTQ
jgi:hypothetical protein